MTAPHVLILYDPYAVHIGTVREHLNAFRLFSAFNVVYCPATRGARLLCPLDVFDAVIIHYSVRVAFEGHLAPEFEAALAQYRGAKVLFCQDEYDQTDRTRAFIARHKVDLFFTCVPDDSINDVYPASRFPETRFVNNLTGYLPIGSDAGPQNWSALADRPFGIVYRGRALPFWYGALGQEKIIIAQRMKAECARRNVACDIEFDVSKRIYGDRWLEFLRSGRATLVTESGANLFDHDGSVRRGVEAYLRAHPRAGFAEVRDAVFPGRDGKFRMNQISPRVFEAIAAGTPLIGFEGTYSSLIRPGAHFIALAKDFSNVDAVFAALADLDGLEAMRRRAFDDVARNPALSYAALVGRVDREIGSALARVTRKRAPLAGAMAPEQRRNAAFALAEPPLVTPIQGFVTGVPLAPPQISLGRAVGMVVRIFLRPILSSISRFIGPQSPGSLRAMIPDKLENWLRKTLIGS